MRLKNSTGRSYFWQWDLCQKLIVEDDCTCKEVHFCNGTSETALVCLIKEADGVRTVNVPNILLQNEGMLTAYLCTRTEDGGETRLSHHFQILPRAKPEEYVYTETEVLNYNSLNDRISQIEDNGVSDEKIAEAVEDYLTEHPVEGGSNLLVVTFTEENGTLTPSHTYDQIKAWVNNGGHAVLTDGKVWYNLATLSGSLVRFERVVIAASESYLLQYVITIMGAMDKLESHYNHINVTAEVGQTIAVKSVDANGKPTEWEAVDMPTGGGGLDATIEGETLVFAESSTATIENETLIL